MKEIEKRVVNNLYSDNFSNPIPTTLNVETTNICNLNCAMCHKVKRPKGFMDINLFIDILDEAVEMGINQVGLHTVGEPILHPRIVDFVRASKLKNVYTYMDINGNNFRENLQEELIDAGLDSIKFSIDGHNQEVYSKIRRGGNLDTVLNNLKKFDQLRKKKKSPMRIYSLFMICKYNEKHAKEFSALIKPYVDEIEVSFVMNQGEHIDGYVSLMPETIKDFLLKNRKETICPNPFKRVVISWDGYLTACSIDFELDLMYAKYEKGKLKEFWHNEKINEIRRKFLNFDTGALPTCRNCDLKFYYLPEITKELNKII